METTIKARLLAFISAKNLSIRQFERACGFSNGYMRQLVDSPSTDKLNQILEAYPEINKVWLLAGEGEVRPGQWDKVRKKVVNHERASTLNSYLLSLLGRAEDAVLQG